MPVGTTEAPVAPHTAGAGHDSDLDLPSPFHGLPSQALSVWRVVSREQTINYRQIEPEQMFLPPNRTWQR